MTIKLELHRIFQNWQKFDVPLFLPAIVPNSYLCNEFLCKLGFSNCPRDKIKTQNTNVARVLRPRGQLENPIYTERSCIQNFIVWNDVPEVLNLLKMVLHLLLTVLTNFSRPVRNVTLNVLSRATVRYLLILQLRGSLQRKKMRIYDSWK
jgi:hypothetical protein